MAQHKKTRLQDLTKFTSMATDDDSTEVEAEVVDTPVVMPSWAGTIVVEGLATGDGRLIQPDALEWTATDEDPQLMRYVQEDVGAHDGAQVVGRIFEIQRKKNGHIWARGDFDMGSEVGREAFRQVDEKLTRGVSVDLDDVSFEIRVSQDVLDEFDELLESLDDGDEPEREIAEDGRAVVARMDADEELFVTTSARIRAATLVATPAFSDAYIEITDYGSFGPDSVVAAAPSITADSIVVTEPILGNTLTAERFTSENVEDALIASAIPSTPPAEWFQNPNLTEATALNITLDGRVYGHVATWDTCHIANPAGDGQCVTAPQSRTGYAYFHTGVVRADDGKDYAVGHITMDTGHAKANASPTSAMAHYDNTGAVVADVQAGEDAYGIWIAGALRPGISEEQVRALRSAPLSGDWRRVGGNLEMVAALAVNVPGFPIPRTQGLVASGATTTLLAAGVLPPRGTPALQNMGLSSSDVNRLRQIIDHSRKTEQNNLLQRVTASQAKMNRRKVESFAKKRSKG